MSSTAGTAGQIISLPKGGGAIQGLGEKFQPDLFTGTGNFTVPIQIPPGRNGFQPQLTLAYSTGNGNSPFGLGWKLSIPEVSRKTSKGVPCYIDSEDVFILSGAEDLVLVKSPEEINTREHYCTRYRPRTEGLYARIEHHRIINNQGGMESDYWEVRSKDGLVSFYGTPGSAGNDSAVITDPGDPTKIFSWKLTETRDPFGNRIEYKYERDSAEEGPHYWDQLYLKQIQYVDYTEQGTTEFLVSIIFKYEEERPDTFSEYSWI